MATNTPERVTRLAGCRGSRGRERHPPVQVLAPCVVVPSEPWTMGKWTLRPPPAQPQPQLPSRLLQQSRPGRASRPQAPPLRPVESSLRALLAVPKEGGIRPHLQVRPEPRLVSRLRAPPLRPVEDALRVPAPQPSGCALANGDSSSRGTGGCASQPLHQMPCQRRGSAPSRRCPRQGRGWPEPHLPPHRWAPCDGQWRSLPPPQRGTAEHPDRLASPAPGGPHRLRAPSQGPRILRQPVARAPGDRHRRQRLRQELPPHRAGSGSAPFSRLRPLRPH
jgi:hypothetical protein